eukprot:2436484-Alexandrium_andersonii.AAC.1
MGWGRTWRYWWFGVSLGRGLHRLESGRPAGPPPVARPSPSPLAGRLPGTRGGRRLTAARSLSGLAPQGATRGSPPEGPPPVARPSRG